MKDINVLRRICYGCFKKLYSKAIIENYLESLIRSEWIKGVEKWIKYNSQWLIKNCTNKKGEIDLSSLNFGKRNVLLNGIKTKGNIDNKAQKAKEIHNGYQEAELMQK